MKKLIGFVTLLLVAGAGADRPNLVFLLTDDQCTYSLGCYGNEDVKTPNIDGLARDGIVFDNHYDTTAICMASRANIVTGMFEYKAGCNFEHGALVRAHWSKSYPMLLRKAGYRTAIAGKIGFEVAESPGGKGILPKDDFDVWGAGPGQTHFETRKNASMAEYADKYPHSSRSYGAFGRDFIEASASSGEPFCLSISFKAPHRPVTPDPVDDHVYAGKKFKKPANYGRKFGAHFSAQSKQGRQYDRFEGWNYDKAYDEVMAKYHQQIYAVDVAVGMIRNALKANKVEKNTVVIFTSDNGFFCGSHGYGSKVLPYEESSRVPMIMYMPGHENSGKQLRSNALTGNVDFAPTLLSLAGVDIPANMDGKSLLPLYENPEAVIHESLPLINVWGPSACHSLAVVTRDFKYIFWNYGGQGFDPVEELYHTRKDPLELTNTVANPEYEAQLEKHRRTYDQYVDHWKSDGVKFHKYEAFGTIFDRTLSWSDKQVIMQQKVESSSDKSKKKEAKRARKKGGER